MCYIFFLLLIASSLWGMEGGNVRERKIRPYTLLCRAIDAGDVKEVKRLIAKGYVPTWQDYTNNEPMFFAFGIKDPEKRNKMIHLLLKTGVNPNSSIGSKCNLTPCQSLLQYAAACRRVDDVALLLGYGADPNRCNADGKTALHEAAFSYRKRHWYKGGDGEQEAMEIMELLRLKGADPERESHHGIKAIALVEDDSLAALMLADFSDYRGLNPDSVRARQELLHSWQLRREIDEEQYSLLGVITGNFEAGFGQNVLPPMSAFSEPNDDVRKTPEDAGKRKRPEMPPVPRKEQRKLP